MKIFYIDLFSGAGGTTTGVHLVEDENGQEYDYRNNLGIEVVACVNHDAKAIESHKANHPSCIHFVEDVRDMKVIAHIGALGRKLRKEHPGCVINLWASLECTNYSKAKGGQPRDADSRTLAYSIYDYIEALQPDYVMIENVREFMSWGPLDENGKPISKRNGIDYLNWIKKMCSYGYRYDWVMLNSADFGAYTSRERYFGQFAKYGLPIKWPEATHAKKVSSGGMFENKMEPWKAVKEVLDLEDEGQSIFNRKKPLVEATLKRIYAGLIKFVAGGEVAFTKVYNSGHDNSRVKSLKEPVGALTTQNSHAVVKCSFLNKNFSGHPQSKAVSIEKPAGTITCVDHHSLVQASMLTSYYGNSNSAQSVDEPCPTITTKDRFSAVFIDQQYGTGVAKSADEPAGTLTCTPKLNVVHATKWLFNPQFSDKGRSLERPCFTLIAKMDKRPPYLIVSEEGKACIATMADDTPMMLKIKEFMNLYGIIDIKMRMLKVAELLKIQGFPEDYILKGTQADQKKFIGNAVVPIVAKAIANANAKALIKDVELVETVA